jgi:poly-gamma-glutamate capsule biosynthesis protein CapA/YwtB (metallophosphatase superfamily)
VNDKPLNLLLAGDVMLGRLVNESLRTVPPEYPWGDTLALFRSAAWRACNLECVIADQGSPWPRYPKAFHFRSDARNVAVLKAAGIDAVSLANNHTLDYDYGAMMEMLRLLDEAKIARSGAGWNRDEAARCAVSEVHGIRIGFLSFTDNEPGWEAGKDRAGICYVPVDRPDERTNELLDRVRAQCASVDVLIVAAHWGGNWGYHAPAEHTALARELIRAGANVVFGHSAHVFRGVEVFQRGLIVYSAGDFVDDYAVDPIERNDRSWAFEIHVEDKRVRSLHLYPTVIREFQARLAAQDEAQVIVEKMQELCGERKTELTFPAAPDRPVIMVS